MSSTIKNRHTGKTLFESLFREALDEEEINDPLAQQVTNSIDGAPSFDDTPGKEALAQELDPGIKPANYLSDPEADKQLRQQIAARNKEISSVIASWANDIDSFIEFLNGMGEDSLQSILAKAEPGTLFAKVASANSRKISNCAQELSGLSESLKSFIGQKAISQA